MNLQIITIKSKNSLRIRREFVVNSWRIRDEFKFFRIREFVTNSPKKNVPIGHGTKYRVRLLHAICKVKINIFSLY